jgi:precorrin-2 dehydrogenase/sirohydrochlorin ferrochelatase
MVCLDLERRDCLVVGGGRVALEKVQGLLECGADVTVVAPEVTPELRALPVRVVERASSIRAVNAVVSDAANERSVPCNVADDPELCSFILPAVVRREPIVVGVSTGGASPALAQRLRSDIGELVGERHVELANRLAALRPWAKRTLPTYEDRRDYFQQLVTEALA